MSRRKIIFFIFCALCNFAVTSRGHSNLLMEEVRSLSELPLQRLLQIKSSLIDDEDSKINEGPSRSTALTLPMALPFKRMGSTKKAIRRHGDYWDEKGKDTKISKIFQLAITALSFLAFGGYLMTLIITAIRRNGNNLNPGNVIVFSNLQNLQKYNRPKRHAWIMDPMENDFEMERMYRGMIMLSQDYAMYNNRG